MKMNLVALVLILISLTSTITFASDNASSTTCYKATSVVPRGAPKAICLRDLEIGSNEGSVILNSDVEDTTKKSLQVTSFIRHNENRAKFEAVTQLEGFSDMPGCGEAAQIYVKLTGQVYAVETPAVAIESMQVSYNHQHDVCHSPTSETIINYVLSK